jgi:hypothetical protein
VGQGSREQFEWGKALAISEAVVNTASAVTKAMPNWAQVALVVATGAAQIAKISSQQFAKQGSPPAAAGTAAAGGAATATEAPAGRGTTHTVNVTLAGGGMHTSESVRELLELLNEEIGDGATINVTAG